MNKNLIFGKSQLIALHLFLSLTTFPILSHAKTSGNIDIVSDYYSRGLDQTGGVSVQGSINYQHDSGFYLGGFASNIKWYDKTGDGLNDSDIEVDLYTGYTTALTKNLDANIEAIFVGYPNQSKYNEYEVSVGLNYKLNADFPTVFSGKASYNPDHNSYLPDPKNQKESAWYITTQADIQLKEDLTLTPQIGYAFGDAHNVNRVGGLDKFINYSLTLNKALENNFSASFSYVGTNLDHADDKIILGISKFFDF